MAIRQAGKQAGRQAGRQEHGGYFLWDGPDLEPEAGSEPGPRAGLGARPGLKPKTLVGAGMAMA